MKRNFDNLLRRKSVHAIGVVLLISWYAVPIFVLSFPSHPIPPIPHPSVVVAYFIVGIGLNLLVRSFKSKSKPRVVVWTHNDLIGVTTMDAFDLGVAQADLCSKVFGEKRLPDPAFAVYFANGGYSDRPGVYPRKEYDRLKQDCEVVESKMFLSPIPNKQIPLATMWMLVHGSVPHDVVRMAELGTTSL